jgi:hypothetical protein
MSSLGILFQRSPSELEPHITILNFTSMALLTISGYPCSGKSIRTNQLKDAFEEQLADPSYNGPVKKVVVVSDDLLNLTRQAYDGK